MAKGKDIKAGSAFIEMFVKTDKMKDGMRRAGKESKGFNKVLAFLGKGWVKFAAGAIAAGFALKKVADFTNSAAEEMRSLSIAADSVQMPVTEFEAMSEAIGQLGGSSKAVEGAFQKIRDAQFEMLTGNQKVIDDFARLGVEVESFARAGAGDGFLMLADVIGSYSTKLEQAKVAQILLGGSASEMLRAIESGSSSIAAATSEMEAFTDPERAAKLEEAARASRLLSAAWKDFKGELAEFFAPWVASLQRGMAIAFKLLQKITSVFTEMSEALFSAMKLLNNIASTVTGIDNPFDIDESSGSSSRDARVEAARQRRDINGENGLLGDVRAMSSTGALASQQSLGLAGAGVTTQDQISQLVQLSQMSLDEQKKINQNLRADKAFGPQ